MVSIVSHLATVKSVGLSECADVYLYERQGREREEGTRHVLLFQKVLRADL